MHVLIIFPYYFFGALTLIGVLILLVRLLRIKVTINAIVMLAMATSAIGLALIMSHDEISARDLKPGPMFVLALLSFIIAGVDAVLMKALPHPVDEELDVEM